MIGRSGQIFRPYLLRNCYIAQIESWALLNLRFGYTCLGIAYWPKDKRHRPWWVPHLSLTFWNHSGQCDQHWVFKVELQRLSLGFKTRGDATPDLATYKDAGWHLRSRFGF